MKKITALAVAAFMLAVAVPAGAQTVDVAALQAQIAQLQAMIAQLQGGATTSTTGSSYQFNSNLTIGSTGADVTALQQILVKGGYLTMPAGVAYGNFGPLTKAAVAKWQAAVGITPAAGYVGTISRAKLNAMAGTSTSTTTTTTTTTSGITTTGVEGTLSVTSSAAGLASTVYEGDQKVAILGAKVEAKDSDISIQRVKLNLGTSTRIYNKLYSKFYVTDGSNVLASVDLNSNTVVKDGSTYYITIAGFNYVVKKGETKSLVIKADVYGTVDSSDVTTLNTGSNSQVSFANDGVRGIDGAGIDQYSPATGFGRTVTVSAELAQNATLSISTNTGTVQSGDVVAKDGSSENELDKLTLLSFDVKAEKDSVKITDLNIGVAKAGSGGATASTTVYLYDGSTELDSASVSAGTAVFNDLDYTVSKDSVKTLTVKADVRNANGTVSQLSATASSTGVTAENSKGDSVTVSGSATGETMYVRNVGPVFTLVSKTISKSATASQSNTSTSTGEAVFTLKIKAVGGDIHFGTTASGTPMVGTSTTFFKVYKNGTALAVGDADFLVASSTAYDTPSSGVTTSGLTNSFNLQENNEITVPVTVRFEGRTAAGSLVGGGSYAVGLEGIKWNGTNTSNFMAGDTDWRTSTISLP